MPSNRANLEEESQKHTHTPRNSVSLVKGFLGTGPPDPTLESASPSPPQGLIWHRFNIDSTLSPHRNRVKSENRCRINVESMTLFRCQIDPWGREGEADSMVGSGWPVPYKPLTMLVIKPRLNISRNALWGKICTKRTFIWCFAGIFNPSAGQNSEPMFTLFDLIFYLIWPYFVSQYATVFFTPKGVSGALRAPGSGVSKKCPESVPGVSGTPFWPFLTLSGHFLDTPEPGARRAPETPRRTLPRTPPVFGDTLGDTPGTLRARRARETPVAGRRNRKPKRHQFPGPFWGPLRNVQFGENGLLASREKFCL